MNRNVLFAGLLMVMTLAVFWRVSEFDFLNYDDQAYVSQNPFIRGGLTSDGILWAFSAGLLFPSANADYWQPVTFLSRMLDIQLFGLDPGMHHLVNLSFHILNVLLLFHLWSRMTGCPGRSFWLAALFAIHPLHVEPVAWITERKDVLCGLFWLLTMWAYLRYVALKKEGGERWGKKELGAYALVAGLFACALMSKPMAVTLPCALLLLDYWPLKRMTEDGGQRTKFDVRRPSSVIGVPLSRFGRLILEKCPLLALSMVSVYLTVRGQYSHVRPHSFFITASNGLVSYARYLVKTINPAGLSIHYPYPGDSLTSFQIGGAIFLLGLISIWALSGARQAPYRLVGWGWFLGTLTPALAPNDIAGADRFTYLPLTGVFLMVIWEIAGWMERRPRLRPFLLFSATTVLAGFLAASWIQVGYWRNSETVVRHSLQATPDDWVVHHQMGIMLLDRGEVDRGEAELQESLRLNPDSAYAHYNLGVAFTGKRKLPEAIQQFETALRLNPNFFDAQGFIGDALLLEGRVDEAARRYFRSIQISPTWGHAHHHLGLCLANRGHFILAEKHFQMALEFSPEPREAERIRAELKNLQGLMPRKLNR